MLTDAIVLFPCVDQECVSFTERLSVHEQEVTDAWLKSGWGSKA